MCVGKGREWGSPFISLITTTEQNTEKQANRYSDNDGARSNVPRREWMPLNQSGEVRSCWMHSAAALQQHSGWEHPPAAAQHTLPGPEQLPSPGHRAAAPVAAVGIKWLSNLCRLSVLILAVIFAFDSSLWTSLNWITKIIAEVSGGCENSSRIFFLVTSCQRSLHSKGDPNIRHCTLRNMHLSNDVCVSGTTRYPSFSICLFI